MNKACVQDGLRQEVPIRVRRLSDNTIRYAVELTIGRTRITAGLDTGSTGLRVLDRVLARNDFAKIATEHTRIAYGVGTVLEGFPVQGLLTLGECCGIVAFQWVDHVTCRTNRSDCAARALPPRQFGIQGNGLPGEGFDAILGINMASIGVGNPLFNLGVRRWIIELPRPGLNEVGRLILNPNEAEVRDHLPVPILGQMEGVGSGLHDAVAGCLKHGETGEKLAGALLLDCGAPGIIACVGQSGKTWPNGTPAKLVIGDGACNRFEMEFVVGRREHAAHLRFEEPVKNRGPVIFAGVMPYLAYTVLHDLEDALLGFRLREHRPPGLMGRPRPGHHRSRSLSSENKE